MINLKDNLKIEATLLLAVLFQEWMLREKIYHYKSISCICKENYSI